MKSQIIATIIFISILMFLNACSTASKELVDNENKAATINLVVTTNKEIKKNVLLVNHYLGRYKPYSFSQYKVEIYGTIKNRYDFKIPTLSISYKFYNKGFNLGIEPLIRTPIIYNIEPNKYATFNIKCNNLEPNTFDNYEIIIYPDYIKKD